MSDDGNNLPAGELLSNSPPIPGLSTPESPAPELDREMELIAPTAISLRVQRANDTGRARTIMAALTEDALWLQDVWQSRRVGIASLDHVELAAKNLEMVLGLRPDVSDETLRLKFTSAGKAEYWHTKLEALRLQIGTGTERESVSSDGLSVLVQEPDVASTELGRVEFTGRSAAMADGGLQLRAAMLGADAVVGTYRCKTTERGSTEWHASGLAVRIPDAIARRQLRDWSFAEQIGAIVRRLLLLLVVQASFLLFAAVFCAGASKFHAASGETPLQALRSVAMWIGLFYAWPLALLVLLRVLHWPSLLRLAGLAGLAATTGRGLAVWGAHLAAVRAAGDGLAARDLVMLVDPMDWAFIVIGIVLCLRAWRLADAAHHILSPESQIMSPRRRVLARVLFGLTAAYALGFVGFVGYSRYATSAYLQLPGVDPKREQEALVAMNQGLAEADNGDLVGAERSWQKSLRIWEELARNRSAPAAYRIDLTNVLNNLGWIHHRQGHTEEAEKYYARAVALADELEGDPQVNDEFRLTIAGAREALAQLQNDKKFQVLEAKDQTAARKYEEAQVKAQKGAAEAEALYAEAVALWEEILPQAESPDYRKIGTIRLATGYLMLAELRLQHGKPREAEAALLKSIAYGDKAIVLAPDRPLAKHNLEVARERLDDLRESEHQGKIERLWANEQFANALELTAKGVDEHEADLQAGKDKESAKRRLAYRLERYAWLLAHCPDGRGRDTKAAVRRARRAVELQPERGEYDYTLAVVQYRNGDWRDSLETLERFKARIGLFDAAGWFLVAMNRQQLMQKEAAKSALRSGVEWMAEQQRKAEEDAVLRFQYELRRPALDALRREAETLIDGKDSSRGVS